MKKLSVVLATFNEESNIAKCLSAVKGLADEIIIMDESSTDKTREIARSFGAKVYKVEHEPIFHVTKQKAIAKATGDWILQLDADEIVTPEMKEEIKFVINAAYDQIKSRIISPKKQKLFSKHMQIIEARDGKLGKKTGEIVAYFLPRKNLFLGKPLVHAGVYPDGVIRLIKKGKAYLPAKSVHEQMVIDGEVEWLVSDLEHHDSPTIERYIERLNRYTTLRAKDLKDAKTSKSLMTFFIYTTIKPVFVFSMLYFRHKGVVDGIRGFLWSAFSSIQYPLGYYKYWLDKNI